MAVVIPDETLYAAHLTAAELKQELAVLLFKQDRLTLLQAAALAEMCPIPFQHLLASRGIPPHYDVSAFEQDLETMSETLLPTKSSGKTLRPKALREFLQVDGPPSSVGALDTDERFERKRHDKL